VTNAGLKELKDSKNLAKLNLSSTLVTDAGLKELMGLKDLSELELRDTKVTEAALKELRATLPRCKVFR
jgi:internalin A